MASSTLTLPDIAGRVIDHFDRLHSLTMLADMALDALPNSTDSDIPRALLTGMAEILAADLGTIGKLHEDLCGINGESSADVCAPGTGVLHG